MCLLIPLDTVIHSVAAAAAATLQCTQWTQRLSRRQSWSWSEDGVSFVIFIATRHALLASSREVTPAKGGMGRRQPFVQGGSGRLCLCLGNTPLWFLFDCCRQQAGAISHTHWKGEGERRGKGRGVLAWNGFGVQVENWIYHLNMPNERQIALWFSFSLPLLIQWKFFVGKSHWDTCNQLVCAAFCNPQSAAPTLAALATSHLPLVLQQFPLIVCFHLLAFLSRALIENYTKGAAVMQGGVGGVSRHAADA